MSFDDQDEAVATNGWSVQIPPLFSRPGPIMITACWQNDTDWTDAFYDDIRKAPSSSLWRSAATKLTEAKTAPASDSEGTYSYMLVGFASPRLDDEWNHMAPTPAGGEQATGNDIDNEYRKPSTAADLGLVVVPLNPPRFFYILLDMVDGLCTPLEFYDIPIFYLPLFQANTISKLRDRRWKQEVGVWDNTLRYDRDVESFYRTVDLDMLDQIYGSSSDDDASLGTSTEETWSESGKSFLPDSEEASSESGSFLPDITEDISHEEESPVESAGEPSNQEETRALSQNDTEDHDTNPEPALRFVDELSQMTAFFDSSQDI
ncbi:hypothetical protein PG993_013400 [Apiospora rasikravindrae]|uniref:Uncharacterized protein n=1 Tax=Apiospora rasikravindrae TaxID=990691 RepID=A0ABR1RXQ1_9PEZI